MFNEVQLGEIEVKLDDEKETEPGAWHAFVDQCIHIEFTQQNNETDEDLEMLQLLNENPGFLQLDKVVGYSNRF